MTRLRFTLKNQAAAQTAEIKKITGVIDVVSNKISYQIIIGTEVAEIYPELMKYLGLDSAEVPEGSVKKNPIKGILDVMSETITPILPAIMSTALISGILSIFTVTGLLSADNSTYLILDSLKTSLFYFLSIFVAVSASKRLKAPTYLALLLAVAVLSPTINGVEGLTLLGIPLQTIEYSNTFIPILLGVWLMGIVHSTVKKYMPKSLDYFFTPLITLLVTFTVTLFLFGPIGTWISNGLTLGVDILRSTIGGWFVLALYAAFQPVLIMLGAGNFIIPIVLSFLSTTGYDPIFIPAYIISDIAVSGAMMGYMLRVKDRQQKQFFGTVSFSAFMGVTEPAVFGAFVKYRTPFLAVAIGGGLGGLYAGIMQVKGYAFTTLFGLLTFANNGDNRNLVNMGIAVIIGFLGAAIAGFIIGLPKGSNSNQEQLKDDQKAPEKSLDKTLILAPLKGKRIPLSEVNDKAFSSGAMGKGLGIQPEEPIVRAPVAGEVMALFPTHHAIGIKSDDGVEVLLHIGIDTVELGGKYFKALVKQEDKVAAGAPLIEVDFNGLKADGYDPTVIMLITNTPDYLDVIPNLSESEDNEKGILTVVL